MEGLCHRAVLLYESEVSFLALQVFGSHLIEFLFHLFILYLDPLSTLELAPQTDNLPLKIDNLCSSLFVDSIGSRHDVLLSFSIRDSTSGRTRADVWQLG